MTQIAMALMAGNAVVMKPSSSVPLIGGKIKEVWEASGLPEGVFDVIQGPGALGEVLIEEGVDRLIFTGSVPVGRHVAKLAAERLIPVTLELGGKDPAIVLADADLESATSGILWGAMTNAGQTCAGIERVYVERPLFKPFVDRIVEKAGKLRVGPDRDFDVDMGAITTPTQLSIIERQVEEAKAAGARVLCGGKALEIGEGRFYAPTVLVDVDPGMSILRDETFGPVLPIVPFDTVDEAVRMANATPFGLSASVWTGDTKRGREIASRLVAGTVTINDSLYTYGLAETPWGGVKDSGIGRTHGREGLLEMTRQVHIAWDRFPRMKKPWWYPYSRNVYDTFKRTLKYLTCPSCETERRAATDMIRDLLFRERI
jgi:succinate-semialdehyde dehydrogenase/glutarate-semialdehyde dehydrogenase